jgi:hypothetical protein
MAIADRIQSMYENVGDVYDTITNVTLPEHKNIENIPSTIRDSYLEIMNNGIDVIWDNWEKVVGEGTELTLSNTEQAPMKVLLKGNTYQEGTPTPDTPQEVHTVSGDNTVEVSNGDNTQSTTYPINLPEGMFLGSIGDYKDRFFKAIEGDSVYDSLDSATKETLDSNEWYLEKKIGKVVLNGTQTISRVNWRVSSTSAGWLYPYSLTNNAIVDYDTNITKANKLLGSTYNDLYNMTVDNGIGTFNANSYGLVVRVKDTTLTTATAINNYLSTNNITAYYGLVTPTYTKIEGTLASQLEALNGAKSYTGQTNISQNNNDLPFILDASALV